MKVAVFGSVHKKGFADACRELIAALSDKQVSMCFESGVAAFLQTQQVSLPGESTLLQIGENWQADMAFSLGGDGTFLKTADAVGSREIPIFGINLGHLGFMVDVSGDEITTAINEIFANGYTTEPRSVLCLSKRTSDGLEHIGHALNEVALLKVDSSSMIKVHTVVDGEYLCTYRADGLIVATPTGSTGYSLSVGSSIMAPQNKSLILSPVAPHSLNQRPVVIPDEWSISLEVESRNGSFLVSLDGRSREMSAGERLLITKAPYSIMVAKRRGHTYFQTLRDKLMWGVDVRTDK